MAVEAALLIPLLIIMAFGMIETALLLRDHVNATTFARAGARVASAEPRFGTVAGHAIGSLLRPGRRRQHGAGGIDAAPEGDRRHLHLPGGPGRAAAERMPGTECLYYKWNDLPAPAGRFVYQASNVPGAFDPTRINACLGDSNVDSVGVRVQVDHPWLLGFFPGTGPRSRPRPS